MWEREICSLHLPYSKVSLVNVSLMARSFQYLNAAVHFGRREHSSMTLDLGTGFQEVSVILFFLYIIHNRYGIFVGTLSRGDSEIILHGNHSSTKRHHDDSPNPALAWGLDPHTGWHGLIFSVELPLIPSPFPRFVLSSQLLFSYICWGTIAITFIWDFCAYPSRK